MLESCNVIGYIALTVICIHQQTFTLRSMKGPTCKCKGATNIRYISASTQSPLDYRVCSIICDVHRMA